MHTLAIAIPAVVTIAVILDDLGVFSELGRSLALFNAAVAGR